MFKNICFSFGWEHAGLISVWKDSESTSDHWVLHLFPSKQFWVWGRQDNYYDGPIIEYGCGPLFMFGYLK